MSKDVNYTPDKGFTAEYDIKEDEEQNIKLQQTIELLLSAGYFRARIKGLSPFDKVVGGMTWCITTCNFDVDVDLLFQENSTIGQKIALTEKIVAVLPRMKCPHRIEPHQIQGLDFIHIYPVIQWLVKRAIETREEMGDYIRAYSTSQFDKYYTMPEDVLFEEQKATATGVISSVKDVYRPRRKYKRDDSDKLREESLRVQSTLLEYGKKFGLRSGETDMSENQDMKRVQSDKEDAEDEARLQAEEEERISALLSGMSVTDQRRNKLTPSAVGSLVGMQSDQIQEIAGQYAEKQAELEKQEKESPKLTGAHQHKRMTASLQKQIEQQKSKLTESQKAFEDLSSQNDEVQNKLSEAEAVRERLEVETEKLADLESDGNEGPLQELRNLVAMNESLKRQEKEFRQHCKEEMERLQSEIGRVKRDTGMADTDDEQTQLIEQQFAADKEKLQKINLLLARKNREISALQRKIDEVPTRAELSQYQRRFVELYNQIATKHKETKQFYTLYNTLDDTKLYLNKEVTLLNSIHDTFEQAMSSQATKEQFLKQLEHIVDGVKQNSNKLEKKKQEEKMRRDRLNDQYLDLVEQQRVYYKTVKDFQAECRKNEILLAKLGE